MLVPTKLQEALDEFNTKYPRPGIEPLTFSTAYDLKNDWPAHYPFKRQQGVYCFADETGALLYIGKTSCSNDFGYRLGGHFKGVPALNYLSHPDARYIYVIVLPGGHSFEAPAIEEWLISRLNPPGNSIGSKAARLKLDKGQL